MEELVRTVILPRLDQLEAEIKALRDVTWPVCQAKREKGNPLSCIDDKRKFFKLLFKDEAAELLRNKAEYAGMQYKLILDEEMDLICTVKDKNI